MGLTAHDLRFILALKQWIVIRIVIWTVWIINIHEINFSTNAGGLTPAPQGLTLCVLDGCEPKYSMISRLISKLNGKHRTLVGICIFATIFDIQAKLITATIGIFNQTKIFSNV